MYPFIELDYTNWLEVRADLSTTTYYIQYDYLYIPFVIDTTNKFIYETGVQRYKPASDNVLLSGAKAIKTIQDITYTANNYGTAGNSITIAYVNTISTATGTVTVVDYTMLAGAVLTVNEVRLTEGIDWTAATDNATTATSLASAISSATEATLSTAVAVGAVITITANTAGTLGNFISLNTSDTINLTVSGTSLSGGTGGAGFETVSVTGSAISVNMTGGVSSAAQILKALTLSSAASELVSFVVSGNGGKAQTAVGATSLMSGANAVTTLSDFETNVKSGATQVASIDQAIGIAI